MVHADAEDAETRSGHPGAEAVDPLTQFREGLIKDLGDPEFAKRFLVEYRKLIDAEREQLAEAQRLNLFILYAWNLESEYPPSNGRGPVEIKYSRMVRDDFENDEVSYLPRTQLDQALRRAQRALRKIPAPTRQPPTREEWIAGIAERRVARADA